MLDDSFKVSLGKLVWIKTRNDFNVHYGSAVIPALKDTFQVQLNEKGLTDFSIPYKFDSYLGDIIDATKKTCGELFNSLSIYRWEKSGADFVTRPVLIGNMSDTGNRFDTVQGGKAYSAFNLANQKLPLCIPPTGLIGSPVNKEKKLGKKNALNAWSVRVGIVSKNSDYLSTIYCASLPENRIARYFPLPPSLSPIKTGVLDNDNGIIFGHAACGDLSKGGTIFEIVCQNTSGESRPIKIFIEKKSDMPAGIKTGLFSSLNAGSNRSKDTAAIDLDPMQKSAILVAVGNEAYLKNFSRIFALPLSLRAVTFNRCIKLVYSLPYYAKTAKVTLYDLMGRSILTRSLDGAMTKEGSVIFPGPIGRGFYVAEIKAIMEGAPQQTLRKKVVYVR